MDRGPSDQLTRRQALGITVAIAGLGGCQGFESNTDAETVTPAAVPEGVITADRLQFRHDSSDEGATGAAIERLLVAFENANEGVEVVEVPLARETNDDGENVSDAASVVYDGIGATLAPRADSLHTLDDIWDDHGDVYPHGVKVSSYVQRDLVAVPQSIHRLNCCYYNPKVLSDAGVTPAEYATVSDLQSAPGALADQVETLFTQPLRSPTELLELWETLLASRLFRQQQYFQYVSGYTDSDTLPIERATQDFDAALSLIPTTDHDRTPEALLNGVVDGTIGFVRQPTWASRHLIDRPDVTYGTDWAVVPLFASPWAISFVARGFAIPRTTSRGAGPQQLLRFATAPDRQREFCATAHSIPARTDIDVNHHPLFAEQATDYAEATMHLPSLAHGIGVRPVVRKRLENVVSAFRDHRDVERAVRELLAAFATAQPL